MPIYDEAEKAIRKQFALLERGERVPMIEIGEFTKKQFTEINTSRAALDLHKLEENKIVFIGRHIYEHRTRDGYSIDDIFVQIASGLSADALAHIERMVSYTQNPKERDDGYGNAVHDRAIFEMTARKPRAELYSVIPKGDTNKPKQKGRP